MDVVVALARLVLAGIFVVSGVAKLLDLQGSQRAVANFGVPERFAKPIGLLLPIGELALAVMLLPVATTTIGAWLSLLLLLAFIGGISYNLSRGNRPDCHCFGQLSTEPIGASTLVRNGVFALLALFIGISGLAGNPGASLLGWTEDRAVFEWILLALLIVMAVVLGAVVWLLVHLLGQNGRLLVRMDKIETALEDADIDFDDDEDDEDEGEEGLPIGAPAPAFSLTGLFGETATLDSLRAQGKPVLLVFSDPGCGPCNALMPELGRWQREFSGKLTTALISRGAPDANKAKVIEHGLSNVLLQKDNEIADAYVTFGTPTAVLVSPDGLVASAAAGGSEEIRQLVTRVVEGNVPNPTRIEIKPAPRRPAPAGSANIGKPAPAIALNDLDDKPVTLADFNGHPTAVLFWNPGCGFCQRMLDDLKAWEANPPADAPKLLIVSTGDAERNREHGLSSPIVLDTGFNVGRSFGASGTPSAVLVDAEGNVASAVAVGAPGVLGLLRNEAPAPAANGAADDDEPAVPAIGTKAPVVRLPDVNGNMIDLADHLGTRTMLLFWNPGCGFCQRMLDDLKKWEANPPKGAPKLMLVSSGDADANKAMELRSPILLDRNFSVGSAFGSSGTPSAILIDAKGNIASDLAVGSPNVMELARSTADGKPAKV
ncbi:MAG: redoxin domain-containing protein [Thermomicrobiales bacterium]|nr:redoxin domain-containing protein [Thermomicrobiales bacterium]